MLIVVPPGKASTLYWIFRNGDS